MGGRSNPSPEPNEADFACSPDMFDDEFEDELQQAEESGVSLCIVWVHFFSLGMNIFLSSSHPHN